MNTSASVSIGPPLLEEPGLGRLSLSGFLLDVCERFSEREALVFDSGDGKTERWTYAELMRQANNVSEALLAGGLQQGERVGLLMCNRLEWVATVFGVALAGGVSVNLSTFATARELQHFLESAEVSVLVLEDSINKSHYLQVLVELGVELGSREPGALQSAVLPELRRVICLDETELQAVELWKDFIDSGADAAYRAVFPTIQEDDPAVVFFSSGSTALAKGILHSHKAVAIQCWRWARLLGVDSEVRSWTPNGFFWSGNFCVLLGATLAVGGTVVMQRLFEPGEALRLMEAERISFPFVWPHQLLSLVEHPAFSNHDLSPLRFVEPDGPFALHPTVQLGSWSFPSRSFGCSETITIHCTFPAGTPASVHGDSNGVPMPGNSLKIIDPLSAETLTQGEHGEIAVKGPTLMLAYLGTPLANSLDSEGYYCTGDGGFIDAHGRLHWQGRLNDVIKTGGANVSPVEVDEIVAQYPGIKVAHTVGVPHDSLGEQVVLCLLAIEGANIDEDDLLAYLKQHLSAFKVPRVVLQLQDADLTLTANAKVRVDALRELANKQLNGG